MTSQIGRFQIRKELGAGGFGVVFEAWDPELERSVALKVLHRKTIAGSEQIELVRREARLAAALSHPGIVTVYEIGEDDGQLFFVMELLDGSDLRDLLAHPAALPIHVVDLGVQISDALDYAHAAGIVHCDLKPRNVRITSAGSVRLLDFGCGQAIRGSRPAPDRVATGTVGYMAPEQIDAEQLDARCDLFALGVLLYEVACSRRPFVGDSTENVLVQTLFHEPPPMDEIRGTALAWLEPVVRRCLEKQPSDRFRSAGDVRDALRRRAAPPDEDRAGSPEQTWAREGTPAPSTASELDSLPTLESVPARESVSASANGSNPHLAVTRRSLPASSDSPVALVFRARDELTGDPGPGEVYLRPISGGPERRLASLVVDAGLAALPVGEGQPARLLLDADPTLDDLLAASFVQALLEGRQLPRDAAAYADYAALAREGLRPGSVPVEDSMEALFQAIRRGAGTDLTEDDTRDRFLARWRRLEQAILHAAGAAVDPFHEGFLRDVAALARERAFLARDQAVYRQDVKRGERWLARVPGRSAELSALYLDQPTSIMFKTWSRDDDDSPTGDCYLVLVVRWGPGRWVCSTEPAQRLSLLALCERLDQDERAEPSARPWFRGEAFDSSLIAAPAGGSRLPDDHVLRAIRDWLEAKPAGPG